MGYSSQAGKLAFATQTAKGTPADVETDGVGMRLRSGTLTSNRELLVPDPEIGGDRDTHDALLGTVSYSGDLEFYLRFRAIGTLLAACFGDSVSALASGANTHTITPSDAAQLPFLTVYEQIGAGLEHSLYSDVAVNTLHLEAEPNGYLTGTCGLIAINKLLGVAPLDVDSTYDDTTMTVGTNVIAKYDGANVKAKGFSFDFTNNFEDDDNRLGQFNLEDLTPKSREVTGSLTLRHNDKALMRQALMGSSAATQPTGLTTKKPVEFNITSYVQIPGSTPALMFGLDVIIPTMVFEPFDFEPSGDDVFESDVNIRALRIGTPPIVTAKLYNDVAALN